MAKPRMDLTAFVGKLLEEQDGDVLREGIRVLSQALMETEVAGLIGAGRTELLRAIFGLDPVRSGRIKVKAHLGPASPAIFVQYKYRLLHCPDAGIHI